MSDILYSIAELRKMYENGVNITLELQKRSKSKLNSLNAILLAYDFQAGTYIRDFEKNQSYYDELTDIFKQELNYNFPNAGSILGKGAKSPVF